ncbi:DUF4358 domain-containing protein [Brevibacillus ruminantium]|uniref:DUF4358 domain-containing protein n=1 Tax=Brevibacillus ruminantium TaxID=2950604 RepID=A0ABY4WLD2_9BACL|nr:DUF4358 domain-containing protein [Brevibacillus ruminantium]USG67897.1 DUF4358 domain-containing protein [Brevibacillus ruminantium]
MITGYRYRKWLLSLLACIFLFGVITGCSSEGDETPTGTAIEVGEHIKQAVNLEEMKQGDMAKLQKLYHIAPEAVEDFILFTSSSNVRAEELLVLKVKDLNQVDDVKENVQKRIEAQTLKFRDYRPEEYQLMEKHVWKVNGKFVLFVVSKNAEQIEHAFDEALQ